MEASSRKIGKPIEKDDEESEAMKEPLAPALFALPSKQHYSQHTGFVHCSITRCGNNRYELSFEASDAETVSIIASKVLTSRTSNYHLFDALRGGMNAKLSKKAGHYVGKLRRDKDQRGVYSLYNSSRVKEEIAAYVYDVPALSKQIVEGQPPRKMQAVIPKHAPSAEGKDGKASNNGRLVEHLHNGTWKHHKLVAVQTRPPKYHEGQYRLNFSGRVLEPSVKNMQLENEQGECLLQFGKVDDKTFHLDYKAPFSAFSAFGAALAQFDL